MTLQEFIAHLDTHGSNLEGWPPDIQADARAIARTPAGRAQLDIACAFDALLVDALPAPQPIGLETRILTHLKADPEPAARPLDLVAWLSEALWRPVTLAIAPLVVGFVLGVAYPETDDGLEDAVSLLVFSQVADDYEEIADAE